MKEGPFLDSKALHGVVFDCYERPGTGGRTRPPRFRRESHSDLVNLRFVRDSGIKETERMFRSADSMGKAQSPTIMARILLEHRQLSFCC